MHVSTLQRIVLFCSAALALFALGAVLASTAAAHRVPSTKREQAGGLAGRAAHLKRVIRVKQHGIAYVMHHRAAYNGKAGAMYWHLYGEAARARRQLAKVQKRRQSTLFRALLAKWLPIMDCESGDGTASPPWSYDWRYNVGLYDGVVNWHPNTWIRSGGGQYAPYAWMASPLEQLLVAEETLRQEGWAAWPVCSIRAGYR